MFDSLSHTDHNSIQHTQSALTSNLWPLLHGLSLLQKRSIKQAKCFGNWHAEQKHRPLLVKRIIILQGGVQGGFKATKIAIHSIHRHRDLRERHCEVLFDFLWHSWEECSKITLEIYLSKDLCLLPAVFPKNYIVICKMALQLCLYLHHDFFNVLKTRN